MGRTKPVVCDECGRLCRDNYNLKKHALTHTQEWCTCFHCGKKVYGKNSVRKHIKTFHLSQVVKSEYLNRCCLCSFDCASVSEIELHLKQDHQVDFEEELKTFDSKEDFLIWKERLESETNSLFVKRRGDRGKEVTVSNFYCHRSGNPRLKPSSSRKRRIRKLGPNRTGDFCPARIQVKCSGDGKVITRGIYKHVGHDFRLERLPLKKSFREKIAKEFLSKNVPFPEIIRHVGKTSPENGVSSRESLLSRKDLHRISRDLRMSLPASSAGPSLIIKTPSNDVFETSQNAEEIVIKDEARASRSSRSREDLVAEMSNIILQAKTNEHLETIHAAALSLKAIIASSPSADNGILTPLIKVTTQTPQREKISTLPKQYPVILSEIKTEEEGSAEVEVMLVSEMELVDDEELALEGDEVREERSSGEACEGVEAARTRNSLRIRTPSTKSWTSTSNIN